MSFTNFDEKTLDTMERLADALERNAEEIQSFKEFLKPELNITETIKRKKQELFNARKDAELFTRGLQEQLKRKEAAIN